MSSDWKLSLLLLGALIAPVLAQGGDSAEVQVPLTTREHLQHESWWPTRQFPDQSQFAGTQACAKCHARILSTQSTTQMALTMMPAASSSILATHTGGIFTYGSYHYAVEKNARSFTLKISDGSQERMEPLRWAFGSGFIAQSYGWWQDGQFYESRFNYFANLHGFDQTPGRLQGAPGSLDMA
jgi:hypothetical protein